MNIILIFTGIIAVEVGVIKGELKCDGVNIDGVYYDTELLKEDLDRPYLLAVDYSTNNLYFSYNIKDTNEENEEFKTARLNLNTKEFTNIEGINNGFAQTVDQTTHEIYVGGTDGIYKYNYVTNKAELYAARDTNIWTIYFKDVLYFSTFPTQFLYTVNNGETVRFRDLEDTKVDHFVIDNEHEMFYTNATGLYSQKMGFKNATLYREDLVMRSLTADINGKVYACMQDGIYVVLKNKTSLEKIHSIDDCFGLAFDSDNNIVYSNPTKLVRLKMNRNKHC